MKAPSPLVGCLITALVLATMVDEPQARGSTLVPGDIVYVDSGNAIDGGYVIKVDSQTGEHTVISSGGYLVSPFDVAIDTRGQVIVSDSGRLVRIDPATGVQRIITRTPIGFTCGIALERTGNVLVANGESILRVNPASGQARVLSAGGELQYPIGVVCNDRGEVFVLNMDFPPEILRLSPSNGSQTVVARGGYLNGPQAIAVSDNHLYITDVVSPDRNFGIGRVIHVDIQTGAQAVVSEGGFLIGPVGIAVKEDGDLIVADPYTINSKASDEPGGAYDGGILLIHPATGEQTLLSQGQAGYLNPRGAEVVPVPRRTPPGLAGGKK